VGTGKMEVNKKMCGFTSGADEAAINSRVA